MTCTLHVPPVHPQADGSGVVTGHVRGECSFATGVLVVREWERKVDLEHRRWSYELDCKPTLDALGITPKIPPKTMPEAASLLDVLNQYAKRRQGLVDGES